MRGESLTMTVPGHDAGVEDNDAELTPPDVPASTKTRLGALCIQSAECESGFCSSGVCCESDCAGVCMSCSTASAAGQCIPVDVGTDPHNNCAEEPASSCGQDGACDGSGACRRYPSGTICREATCTGTTLTPAGRCDSAGTCGAATTLICSPYRCGTDSRCNTTCTSDGDCVAPATCQSGTCGPKAPGAACTAPNQCASGFCEQGICCGTTCGGACRSCALPGSPGTCTQVPVSANALCPESCATTADCASPTVCGGGACGGLRGQYFDTMDFMQSRLIRTDGAVDFTWPEGGSPDSSVQAGSWSVVWTGRVVARFSETYTFFTFADDGTRLWVNSVQLIDDWDDHPARERSGTIALTAGQPVTIRLEYYNNNGGATARLLWSSANEPKAPIPTSALRPQ
jgi:hypothetical protein